jgi:hypothetical protein
MLAHWAKKYFSENHLALLLHDLFRIDGARPNCFTYEQFHAIWEAIRYYVFVQSRNLQKGKSKYIRILMPISEIYNGFGQKQKYRN